GRSLGAADRQGRPVPAGRRGRRRDGRDARRGRGQRRQERDGLRDGRPAAHRLEDQEAVKPVGYADAPPKLRDVYDRMRERPLPPAYRPAHGGIPGIIEAHGLDPELVGKVFATSTTLNGAGPLAWPERELVNALTSRLNQCFY